MDVHGSSRPAYHGQSLDPSAHNVYRSRTVAQQQQERELANENDIRAREMASIVRKADSPGYDYFRTRDIYNDRQAIKRERLNGLTATQAFVKELESGGIRVRTLRDEEERPRLNADSKKLKVPRYLKIADYTSKPGSDADNTDDDDAEAEPEQRSQGRYPARGRGLSRQPSQSAGRGTRRMNASLLRDRSQFELDELQSLASTSPWRGCRTKSCGGVTGREVAGKPGPRVTRIVSQELYYHPRNAIGCSTMMAHGKKRGLKD